MSPAPVNKALELTAFGAPLRRTERPMPEAGPGSVVTRVLASPVLPYAHHVFSGNLPALKLKPPFVPNSSSIGRVTAVGPDAVRIKVGDLVFLKSQVIARDDPRAKIVPGHINGTTPEGQKLMAEVWKDGSFQQYQKVPLETCFKLDENRLCNELNYTPVVLHSLLMYAVAAGAILEAADLKAGETIVIGPSGGVFSGLAVEMALAVGGNVIALGRSKAKLEAAKQRVNSEHFHYVVMTGDEEVDFANVMAMTPGGEGAEVYNDWTPGDADKAWWLGVGSRILKLEGRLVLSGGFDGGLTGIHYAQTGFKDIAILNKWVCNRKTVERLLAMVHMGLVKIGPESGSKFREFKLDDVEEAIAYARDECGWGNYAVMCP